MALESRVELGRLERLLVFTLTIAVGCVLVVSFAQQTQSIHCPAVQELTPREEPAIAPFAKYRMMVRLLYDTNQGIVVHCEAHLLCFHFSIYSSNGGNPLDLSRWSVVLPWSIQLERYEQLFIYLPRGKPREALPCFLGSLHPMRIQASTHQQTESIFPPFLVDLVLFEDLKSLLHIFHRQWNWS